MFVVELRPAQTHLRSNVLSMPSMPWSPGLASAHRSPRWIAPPCARSCARFSNSRSYLPSNCGSSPGSLQLLPPHLRLAWPRPHVPAPLLISFRIRTYARHPGGYPLPVSRRIFSRLHRTPLESQRFPTRAANPFRTISFTKNRGAFARSHGHQELSRDHKVPRRSFLPSALSFHLPARRLYNARPKLRSSRRIPQGISAQLAGGVM